MNFLFFPLYLYFPASFLCLVFILSCFFIFALKIYVMFVKILDTDDLKELEMLFAVPQMGKSSVDILLINTVIPYKYAYALHQNNPVKAEQAMRLMEKIPAENNTIVRQWRVLGRG